MPVLESFCRVMLLSPVQYKDSRYAKPGQVRRNLAGLGTVIWEIVINCLHLTSGSY